MGCFLPCFGSSNIKKRRRPGTNRVPSGAKVERRGYDSIKQVVYPGESLDTAQRVVLRNEIKPVEQTESLSEGKLESLTGLISVFQDKGADEPRDGIYEPGKEEASTENRNLTSLTGLDLRSVEKSADKLGSEGKKVIFDPVVITHKPLENCEFVDEDFSGEGKIKSLSKSSNSDSLSEAGSSNFSLVSYLTNHGYQNCRESDDEGDGLDYVESDMDVGDGELEDGESTDGYELSDSVCSMDSITRLSSGDAISPQVNFQRKKVEATDYTCSGDDYDQSILSPVENVLQWKSLKARGKQQLQSEDTNSALDRQELSSGSYTGNQHNVNQAASIKPKVAHQEQQTQPMAADASLSNWLPSSETKASQNDIVPQQTMSRGSFSPKNLEDNPIPGALTVEELKLMSTTSSPISTPTKSPDDIAIIGSVGSHWSSQESNKDSDSVSSYKGIPNTTSKYREDKRVNWHSTPFETRLEKALSRGSARA